MNYNISEQSILNLEQPIDVAVFDQMVFNMYHGSGKEMEKAQSALEQFSENPLAWTKVDKILESTAREETKFFALHVLEKMIRSQWKVMPSEQSMGIRNFVISQIWLMSSDFETIEKNKMYLMKLINLLSQILKHDWPSKWPDLFPILVESCKQSLSRFFVSIKIIQAFSEELFDFSSGKIIQTKAKFLKERFVQEFPPIFDICLDALRSCDSTILLSSIFETMLKFLTWLPVGYIFDTTLIDTLLNSGYLESPLLANDVLSCLVEIVSMPPSDEYAPKIIHIFQSVVTIVINIIPENTPFPSAYRDANPEQRKFLEKLPLFLSNAQQKLFISLCTEDANLSACFITSLNYLLGITTIEDNEVFKGCLNFWVAFSEFMYYYCHPSSSGDSNSSCNFGSMTDMSSRLLIRYGDFLSKLRFTMISHVARPEEVCVVEQENGDVVREVLTDTDSINSYNQCRQVLVYLTHLNYEDMYKVIVAKLYKLADGSEFSNKLLNSLCWAIGSISGTMNEEMEVRFLVVVLKELLNLCERTRGVNNKAIIATGIMYIVGQYPRFLQSHWKFFKTVINKLMEFMHECHDGVQDMAVDTFLKISRKCGSLFVTIPPDHCYPFIDEIVMELPQHINDLNTDQIRTFFEALGTAISTEAIPSEKENFITKTLNYHMEIYENIIQNFIQNPENLLVNEILDTLVRFYKINNAICKTVGPHYEIQISRIFDKMVKVYTSLSQAILTVYQNNLNRPVLGGAILTAKKMSAVKRSTLALITTWVSSSICGHKVYSDYLLPILQPICLDYLSCPPDMRISEVLVLFSATIEKYGDLMVSSVSDIITSLFTCTMEMINRDFTQYPDHRKEVFVLLDKIAQHCFAGVFLLSDDQLKLVIDSIIWSFKHTMNDVAETGLDILLKILENYDAQSTASHDVAKVKEFYSRYFLLLLDHILSVATDITYAQLLERHACVISYFFYLIKQNRLLVPVSVEISNPEENLTFVQNHLWKLLSEAFPHLKDTNLVVFIKGITVLENNSDMEEHLRDFLVQVMEMQGEDSDVFFMMEREKELEKIKEEKQKVLSQIPGMVNPYDM